MVYMYVCVCARVHVTDVIPLTAQLVDDDVTLPFIVFLSFRLDNIKLMCNTLSKHNGGIIK